MSGVVVPFFDPVSAAMRAEAERRAISFEQLRDELARGAWIERGERMAEMAVAIAIEALDITEGDTTLALWIMDEARKRVLNPPQPGEDGAGAAP